MEEQIGIRKLMQIGGSATGLNRFIKRREKREQQRWERVSGEREGRRRRFLPSPRRSDSAADDLWRALSSAVIGRHVASQCGNESISEGTRGKILCGWQFFRQTRRVSRLCFSLLLQRGEKKKEGRVASHGRNHPVESHI